MNVGDHFVKHFVKQNLQQHKFSHLITIKLSYLTFKMGPHSGDEDGLNADTVVNNKEFFNMWI